MHDIIMKEIIFCFAVMTSIGFRLDCKSLVVCSTITSGLSCVCIGFIPNGEENKGINYFKYSIVYIYSIHTTFFALYKLKDNLY